MLSADGKYTRDRGAPWGAIVSFIVCVALFVGLYLFVMSRLFQRWNEPSMIFFAGVSIVASLVLGVLFGGISFVVYGNRSLSYWHGLGVIVFVVTALYGWLLFGSDFLDAYEGGARTCISIMGIALGIEPITQVIAAKSMLKNGYCPRCDMTEIVEMAEKENEEVTYGYEFCDHPSKEERATIRNSDEYYEVTYRTQGYQENLGLHKYHKYNQVYRCRCCGYEKRESVRNVTKV